MRIFQFLSSIRLKEADCKNHDFTGYGWLVLCYISDLVYCEAYKINIILILNDIYSVLNEDNFLLNFTKEA